MSEVKVRDRVFIMKEHRDIYQELRIGPGDLKGASNPNLFLIAMVLGFDKKGKDGLNEKIPKLNDGLVRTISFNTDEWNFIKSFAIYIEEDVNVIGNVNRMLDIAEIYAYHGIEILYEKYSISLKIDFLEDLINNKL